MFDWVNDRKLYNPNGSANHGKLIELQKKFGKFRTCSMEEKISMYKESELELDPEVRIILMLRNKNIYWTFKYHFNNKI